MLRRSLGLLLLAACAPTTPDGPDVAEPDAECAVVDCADPACAAELECTWPERLTLASDVDFAGATIDCFIPIDVDDCATDATAELERVTDGACPACDLTFAGPLSYQRDTCSELGNFDLPSASSGPSTSGGSGPRARPSRARAVSSSSPRSRTSSSTSRSAGRGCRRWAP